MRLKVAEQAPGSPGQADILDRALVDDDKAVAARGADNGGAHDPPVPMMIRATSVAG